MARILTFDLPAVAAADFIGVIFFLGRKQSRAGQLGRVGIGLADPAGAGVDCAGCHADHPCQRCTGHLRLVNRRYYAGCADRRSIRHRQLLQPGSGPADGDLNRRRVISFPVALCSVIGANLGSGLLAMLNNSAANAAARRVALGSLLFKLVGSLIILPFVHPLANLMDNLSLPKAELVIYFHVFYNRYAVWRWCRLPRRWPASASG